MNEKFWGWALLIVLVLALVVLAVVSVYRPG